MTWCNWHVFPLNTDKLAFTQAGSRIFGDLFLSFCCVFLLNYLLLFINVTFLSEITVFK